MAATDVASASLSYEDLPINVSATVTPDRPLSEQPAIGLIGMGAMGTMYANRLSSAGWKKCVQSCQLILFTRVPDATESTSAISQRSLKR